MVVRQIVALLVGVRFPLGVLKLLIITALQVRAVSESYR